MIVYWLYITGDQFLLELGGADQEQTFPWTDIFLHEENHQQAIALALRRNERLPVRFCRDRFTYRVADRRDGRSELSQGLKLPVLLSAAP